MTADRDALRDLLGFLERAIREVNFGDLSGEAHDTAARARRHLDRTEQAPALRPPDEARAHELWRAARYADPADAPDGPEEVIAAAIAETRERTLAPFRELFSGGPDTACRTTWREVPGIIGGERNRTECVEVPMDELRAAFDAAEGER